jgi:quercetin dioxygenase-like cupin family protein
MSKTFSQDRYIMFFDETRIPEDMRIQLSGFLEPGMAHHRNMRFDELYEFLPKDASVRVGVYTSEIAPGGATAWHLHNGAGFFLVLQGRITIEFKDTVRHYRAGDAYAEPIGVIHRAVNPETEIPFICVGFVVTPKDRDHVVNVKEPW